MIAVLLDAYRVMLAAGLIALLLAFLFGPNPRDPK